MHIYTLLVDIGLRKDIGPLIGLAQLTVNNIPVAAGIGLAPVRGSWSTFTATYLATLADDGQALGILLAHPGPTDSQANFDNVRLSDDTIPSATAPEPGSLVLLGSALAGLSAIRRRKARR